MSRYTIPVMAICKPRMLAVVDNVALLPNPHKDTLYMPLNRKKCSMKEVE
jgi:hypothetical protein